MKTVLALAFLLVISAQQAALAQVVVMPFLGKPTDKGGTITAGGTAQTVFTANSEAKKRICENPTTESEPLYFSVIGNSAVAGAGNVADLVPGGSAGTEVFGNGVVTVNAATTGHRFICTEWQ